MSKLIKCKTCGAEIAKNAKACPQCGAKNKKPIFKRWWFWTIIVVVVLLVCCSEPADPEQPDLSEADYKAACEEIDYDTLARNPENYAGNLYTFTGEVEQVIDYDSYIEMRINVTPVIEFDEVWYYEDTIYVKYYPEDGADKILEGDIITIYGLCAGEETYISILGEEITLPKINIMYYELVSE